MSCAAHTRSSASHLRRSPGLRSLSELCEFSVMSSPVFLSSGFVTHIVVGRRRHSSHQPLGGDSGGDPGSVAVWGPLSRSFGPPPFAVWHRFRPVSGLPTTRNEITSPRRPSTRRRGSGTRRRGGCHPGRRSRQPGRTDGTILSRNHRPKVVGGVSGSDAPLEDLPRYLCFCRLRLQLRVALLLAWFASSGKSPCLVPVQ